MKREITHPCLRLNQLSHLLFLYTSLLRDVAIVDILVIILTYICYKLFLLLI